MTTTDEQKPTNVVELRPRRAAPKPSDPDFDARLARIRASLSRIDLLMDQLRLLAKGRRHDD